MEDFIWEGEDNFFEAMHHMATLLEEEAIIAKENGGLSVQEKELSGASGGVLPSDGGIA